MFGWDMVGSKWASRPSSFALPAPSEFAALAVGDRGGGGVRGRFLWPAQPLATWAHILLDA